VHRTRDFFLEGQPVPPSCDKGPGAVSCSVCSAVKYKRDAASLSSSSSYVFFRARVVAPLSCFRVGCVQWLPGGCFVFRVLDKAKARILRDNAPAWGAKLRPHRTWIAHRGPSCLPCVVTEDRGVCMCREGCCSCLTCVPCVVVRCGCCAAVGFVKRLPAGALE